MSTETDLIENQIEVSSAIIKIREDGIVHTHVKSEIEFNIEDTYSLLEARTKLTKGNKHVILCTGSKFVIPSNEVRTYLSSKKRNELIIAEAFVINSLPQRLISNFYIQFNKPIRPTKAFTDVDKAIKWLKSFL